MLLERLQGYLRLVPGLDPRRYSLKAYRAGRATELASSGDLSFAQIQSAGEWSDKRSPLAYINQDHVDEAVALRLMVSSIYYGQCEVQGVKVDDDADDPENVPPSIG